MGDDHIRRQQRYQRALGLCLAAVLSLPASSAGAGDRGRVKLNRESIVSPEDVSYRLLARLAADERVPGVSSVYFTGEFQWTRLEMARFVASALKYRNSEFGIRNSDKNGGQWPVIGGEDESRITNHESRTSASFFANATENRSDTPEWADRALVALAEEYRNELEYLGALRVGGEVGGQGSGVRGNVPRGELSDQREEASPNSEIRVPNSEHLYDHSALGIAQLSVRVEGTGAAEMEGSLGLLEQLGSPQRFAWVGLRPRITTLRAPTRPVLPARPLVHEAEISTYRPDFRLRVGLDHVRWGPGYRGTFPLSDFPDPFPMIEYRGRLHSLLYNVEPWRPFFSALHWVIGSYPDQGVQTYIFARRADFELGNDLDFGLYELAKSDRPPLLSYLLVPIAIAENLEGRLNPNFPGTLFSNKLIGADMTFRAGPSLNLYGELSVDDINAQAVAQRLGLLEVLRDFFRPLGLGLFRGPPGPNLVGAQIGAYLPRISSEKTRLRVEYALTTPNYGIHRNRPLDLSRSGLSLGHPIGSDASSLYVRFERLASERNAASVEYEARVAGRRTAVPRASDAFRLRYYYSAKPSATYSLGLDLGASAPLFSMGALLVF